MKDRGVRKAENYERKELEKEERDKGIWSPFLLFHLHYTPALTELFSSLSCFSVALFEFRRIN